MLPLYSRAIDLLVHPCRSGTPARAGGPWVSIRSTMCPAIRSSAAASSGPSPSNTSWRTFST